MGPAHEHGEGNIGRIRLAFFLNLVFTILEIIGGFWTNSVAILSDAVHDLGDCLSLGSAWYLERYSNRTRDLKYSYGYRRFSVLGALLNAVVLLAGSFFILSEAVPRLMNPEHSNAEGMILFAIVGIVVNGAAVLRLRGQSSLNVSVVAWHLLEDVLGWVAVLIVAVTLLFTDLHLLDPILSIIITLYVLYNVVRNLRKTLRVFLQAVPEGVEVDVVEDKIKQLEGVKGVHHTHVWSLDGEHHVITTHVVLEGAFEGPRIREIRNRIREAADELGIWHVTVEMEPEDHQCEDADCD
jgi:cobalt-zinc-cadmium efflux system protein